MIKQLLIIVVTAAVSAACVANQYEDCQHGIVISAVEYDNKPFSKGCQGDFKCDKGALECVYYFHEQAQKHIDDAKFLIKKGGDATPVSIEFYNALCNLYEVKVRLKTLAEESSQDWEILDKTGLIKQTDLVMLILSAKIRQLELESGGSCDETGDCPDTGF